MQDMVIENGVLVQYRGPGGEVVIPAGVRSVGPYAFYFCADPLSLTKLILPDSVTDIGDELLGPWVSETLREFQADGIPEVAMLDNEYVDRYEWEASQGQEQGEVMLPPGVSINRVLVGPLLRNFARRRLAGEEIPAEIVSNRTQYLRQTMLEAGEEFRYSSSLHFTSYEGIPHLFWTTSWSHILEEAVRFSDSPELLELLFQEGLVNSADVSHLMDEVGDWLEWEEDANVVPQALIMEYARRYLPNAEPEISD